jgi:uncharacterized protein YkwD
MRWLLLILILPAMVSFKATGSLNPRDPSPNKLLLLKLVNEARKKGCQCGDTYYYPAAPLVLNPRLEKAAFAHSQDMEKKKYFSHISPGGGKAGQRIKKQGYSWRAYGENIAHGYKSEKQVLDGWLRSPGHCRNIMNPAFKEMGIGRSGTYWTQTFGSR